MIVLLSSEENLENEAELINELFESGLTYFHIRKPNSTEIQVAKLLDKIEPKFYKYISLHQYHFMAKEYGINRIHLNSKNINLFENFSLEKFTLSCSVHSMEEYNLLPQNIFNYCFLSPVFNSISKINYLEKDFNLSIKDKSIKTKIIALGGINEINCTENKLEKYSGIALLGGIWNNNPIDSFLKIKEKVKNL